MAQRGVSLRRGLGICLVQWCLAWLLRDAFAGWSLVGRPGRPHGQAARTLDPRTREELRIERIEDSKRWVASEIENAADWDDLIRSLDSILNGPYFSGLAASAAYRQLVNKDWSAHLGEQDWDSSLRLRLHARVEDLARDDQLGEVFDEILLSIAKPSKLSDPLKPPIRLLSLLVESSPGKMNGMSAQGLSNSLEACARLKDIMPGVLKLVPDIFVQIPEKAKNMVPSALSTCLWACVRLRDSVLPSDIQMPFEALAVEIPDKVKDMNEPDLTKCLWALAQLKDVRPLDVKKLVPVISAHITEFDVSHQELSPELAANLLWAVAELKDITFPILKPERQLEFLAWRVASRAGKVSPSELRSCTWAVVQLLHELHQLQREDDFCDFDLIEWREYAAEKVASNESLVADLRNWTMAVGWFHNQPKELRDDAEEALNEVFAGNLKFATHSDSDTLVTRERFLNHLYYRLLLGDPVSRTDLARTLGTALDTAFNTAFYSLRQPVGLVLMIVHACARRGFRDDELLTSVSDYFLQTQTSFSSLSDLELCSLSWAWQSLAQDDFRDFQKLLTSEVTNRGLSRADVKRGQHGIFLWRESTVSESSALLNLLSSGLSSQFGPCAVTY